MKVLLIQENGRHTANRHFRECYSLKRAFEHHGHEAQVWGLGHENYRSPPNFNGFDLIFNLENYDETGWLPDLSAAKPYKVLWAIDEHCGRSGYYQKIATRDKVNLVLHSTLDYVDANGIWFPNCYDHTLVYPLVVPKRADVGFCGSVGNRGEQLDLLKARFDFVADIFVIGHKMVEAINSYRVSFNRNMANDVNYRNFETMGCGVPLVTSSNHQYAPLGFVDLDNCVLYNNNAELLDKIRLVLGNGELLAKIGANGLSLAAKHTYNVRVGELLHSLHF